MLASLRNHLNRQDPKEIMGVSAQIQDLDLKLQWEGPTQRCLEMILSPPTGVLRIETPPKSFQNVKGRKCSKVDPNKCSPACHIPWHLVVFRRKSSRKVMELERGTKESNDVQLVVEVYKLFELKGPTCTSASSILVNLGHKNIVPLKSPRPLQT